MPDSLPPIRIEIGLRELLGVFISQKLIEGLIPDLKGDQKKQLAEVCECLYFFTKSDSPLPLQDRLGMGSRKKMLAAVSIFEKFNPEELSQLKAFRKIIHSLTPEERGHLRAIAFATDAALTFDKTGGMRSYSDRPIRGIRSVIPVVW